MGKYRILIVDDDEDIRVLITTILQKENYETFSANNYTGAVAMLDSTAVDLMITDVSMADENTPNLRTPDEQGMDLLKFCRKNHPEVIVILLTGIPSMQAAMEAIKIGAYDYINKPFKKDKLILTIGNALKEKDLLNENTALHNILQRDLTQPFVFASKKMQQISYLIDKVAPTDAGPILIRGETGVGKEIIAKTIHNLSSRKNHPFLEINCTSLQEKLLENELFGHEKGAFTDARETKKGLFEIATEGTLFLDEIGDIDISIQAKLLKVLESRQFFRLGGTQSITTNTRIIAATNKNLEQAIKDKTYREDLYYRLKMINLTIPPLRERIDDVVPLTNLFLQQFNKKFTKNFTSIHPHAEKILLSYNWPGNVRELRNMIERIVLLEEDDMIKVRHLPIEMFDKLLASDLDPKTEPIPEMSLPEPLKKDQNSTASNHIETMMNATGKFIALAEMEHLYIQKVLKYTKGNKSQAADILGINRKTLWEKLKKET